MAAASALACSVSRSDQTDDSAEQPIVGGTPDMGHRYVVRTSGGCSGTMISKRTVLLAAHCSQVSWDYVTVGYSISSGPPRIRVLASARHPGFRGETGATAGGSHVVTTYSNDLAVLKLESSPVTQAPPLLRETMDNGPDYVGPLFTFVGFGATQVGGTSGGSKSQVQLPISLVGVGPVPAGGYVDRLDDSQFYYRVPGKNTCYGDSGGPAFLIKNGVEHLAGVTSSGDDRCKIDGINARTDGPAIRDFIQDKIDEYEEMDPCRSDGQCNESCNDKGYVDDPDCAVEHCTADGVCALACTSDPDCVGGDPRCRTDGICHADCVGADRDCTAETPPRTNVLGRADFVPSGPYFISGTFELPFVPFALPVVGSFGNPWPPTSPGFGSSLSFELTKVDAAEPRVFTDVLELQGTVPGRKLSFALTRIPPGQYDLVVRYRDRDRPDATGKEFVGYPGGTVEAPVTQHARATRIVVTSSSVTGIDFGLGLPSAN